MGDNARARRQATVTGRGGAKFKNALEELAALRKSGGKRADIYDVKEEEAVYDEVDEDEYARIVQKRREEGGGFVVGEEGLGYNDIGEEIDWINEDASDKAAAPARAKGGKGKDIGGTGNKRKAAEQPKPGAKARMQKMFQAATTKHRPVKAPVDDKSTEDLLDDILGGLDAGGVGGRSTSAAPSSAFRGVTAAPNVPPPVRSTPPSAPPVRSFSRQPSRPSFGTPKSVSFAPLPTSTGNLATTNESKHRLARAHGAPSTSPEHASLPRPGVQRQGASTRPELLQLDAEQDADDDDGAVDMEFDYAPLDEGMVAGEDDDNYPEEENQDADADNTVGAAGNQEGAVPETMQEKEDAVETTAAATTPAPHKANASSTPWRTPAGAKAEVQTPATAVPAAGWQAVYDRENDTDESAAAAEEANPPPWQDDGTLPLDENSQLPFYLLDAHEELAQPGTVFLFGKIPAGQENTGQFVSCCAVVKTMPRTIFVVPREPISSPEISELAAEIDAGDADARKRLIPVLHAALAAVKSEVRDVLARHGVTQFTMKPVSRHYAFENKAVRHGKQWVLKVRYPATQPALPLGVSGDSFSTIFGTNQSFLESLVLKRRLMGPAWMSLRQPRRVDTSAQMSYCRVEVEVEGHKAVFAAADGSRPAPPLTVAAVHLKTIINPTTAVNEIVAASVVYLPKVTTDGPTQFASRDLRHFSAVRRLDGVGFPSGFDAAVKSTNESEVGRRNGGAVLSMQGNERALLTMLVCRLRDLDADAFVGHNFAAFDLDVLLHRMQTLKVPHWSSLGRLKRSKFPSLGGGGHTFGGGAGAGQLSVVAGRLLCDTYLAARDLVRETEYTLSTLSKNLLGETRCELSSADIPAKYATAQKLMELVHHTESDAWLSLRLAHYLAVLPLTRQLAELSGSLWSKALLNQRAQRIEYLLLHEFHNNKFLLPDKLSHRERERLEKVAASLEGDDGAEDGKETMANGKRKGGKGPQYTGGLVLEPKKGLYERYILLLDFNSLYPSIIQEYNICFTTVNRPEDGSVPSLPEVVGDKAPLPRVIGALVQRRRRVKELIKGERDNTRREQLNIRQQALKLLANSMYGCLGFSHSRFYAKPLAELITSQGREILQSTVDLVQGNVGKEVVYGDTDSIMINTDTDNLADVIALGQAIKREVNKRYRLLEIEIDGVFRCMLLLKKKKYAAVKVDRAPDGTTIQTVEAKGLDMVRRDWCPLAKQASHYVLDRILSCQPREEVVATIHDHLSALATAVNAGQVPLHKFVITKQLTKRPEDYPDAKNQPHVQVAVRRRAAGKRDGVAPGETIAYVICNEIDAEGNLLPAEKGLADRAYGPDEVTSSNGRLRIDIQYYIAQQVFPVVSRLVAPIAGTDAARIAESLGLDPSRYRGAAAAGSAETREEALLAAAAGLDDDDRFKSCAPLILKTSDGKQVRFSGVRALLQGGASAVESALLPLDREEGGISAPLRLSPAQVANQVRVFMRQAVAKYYEGRLKSDDDMMPCVTRNVCLREPHDGKMGTAPPDLRCTGTMHQEVTESELYTQLSYIHRLFDVDGALHALGDGKDARAAAEELLAPLRPIFDAGAGEAAKVRDRSAYRWIDMSSVFGRMVAG